MRILVLGSGRPDRAADSLAEILALRHEVTLFPFEQGFQPFPSRLYALNAPLRLGLKVIRKPASFFADRWLLRWLGGRRFDMVLTTAVTSHPPSLIRELRARTGALVIGWFPDTIARMDGAEFTGAPFDRLFFKDKVITERLRSALATDRYDFLPQAFDPWIHRPVADRFAPPDAAVDVAIFGNSYAYRAELMGPLLATREIRTVVYGDPSYDCDPRLRAVYRPAVRGTAKSAAMRLASIALNTNLYAELGGVNKRTFELAAMGAFQLTDAPRIAEYFEPGVECATFRGPHDLVDQVRHWLALPAERAAIARRGLVRAFREHTYNHRLNEMFDRVPALRGEPKIPVPVGPPDPDGEIELAGGTPERRLTRVFSK
ncbi:MAG: glycosyltransferase [Minicystis sp.]